MAVVTEDRALFSHDEAAPDWTERQDHLVRRAVRIAADASAEVAARFARAGLDPATVAGLDDLAGLPVLPKDDLPSLQAADPPFGGMLATRLDQLERIFTSPGPILDPQGPGPDYWRMAPALWATGFRPGHVVLNTFSYHLTPGGTMMDAGLREVGCVVIPGGVGNSAAQVAIAHATGAMGYVGTPQFLVTLLEKARELGTPLRITRAMVTGAPFPPALRHRVRDELGVEAYEAYGTADAGALGYECHERRGWHVAPGVVIEITDPATGVPLDPGETGEVVVTSPNEVYPLVRFGTGDLSAWIPGEGESPRATVCPCGRSTPRLAGFLGRVGEGVKVKGMFVHPRQIDRALAAFSEAARYQAVVTATGHLDRLVVRVERRTGTDPDPTALKRALEEAVKLRLEVEIVDEGTLPDDARRVVDERSY
jgi:phenylacetate-CoA ligase